MRTSVRSVLAALAAATALWTGAGTAQAEPLGTSSRTGVDVSWPQCGTALPTGLSYAIVGVNGGTAATTNACLADQLSWAAASTTSGDSAQPRVQLYVNTGNPGEVLEQYGVRTWPTDNLDPRGRDSSGTTVAEHRNPYGRCTTTPGSYQGYTNDLACSWQYGWNRAVEAVDDRFGPAAAAAGMSGSAADYTWWLDVETMNSWQQGGPEAQARNAATLEGMTQLYLTEGVGTVGLYSTASQWSQVVGSTLSAPAGTNPATGANLVRLPSWLAGAADAADAQVRCTTAEGLTGGPVVLNQYIADGLDYNHSCA